MSTIRRQIVPVFFVLVVAFVYAGPLSRLHLLFILLAKPALTLAFAGLLLFVIVRSSDVCSKLQIDLAAVWVRCFVAGTRCVSYWEAQADPVPSELAGLTPLLQRPPPFLSR